MAFDAGSILGKLGLETSEFRASMEEGAGLAEHGGAIIGEVFHGVAGALDEAFGTPALGMIANFTSELLSGPLGALEAVGQAAGLFREMVTEVGEDAARAGINAEKAGVSVEFFSKLQHVAAAVGIETNSVVTGFDFLARAAEQALEKTQKESEKIDAIRAKGGRNEYSKIEAAEAKATETAFEKLGISAAFLRDHLNDMEGLFNEVMHRLDELPSHAERAAVAHQLLGRGAKEMVPLLAMGSEEIRKLGDEFEKLNAIETEESAKTGRSFVVMEAEARAAWEGIKRAAAEPILNYLVDHEAEIKADITDIAQTLRDKLPEALEKSKEILQEIGPLVKDISGWVKNVADFSDKWAPRLDATRQALFGADAMGSPAGGGPGYTFNYYAKDQEDDQILSDIKQSLRESRQRDEEEMEKKFYQMNNMIATLRW